MNEFICKNISEVKYEENELSRVKKLIENDYFKCLMSQLKPGKVIPVHKHMDMDQTFIFLKGTGECTVNGTVIEAIKDTVIFIKAGAEHSLKNSGNRSLGYIEVTVSSR